MPRPGSRILHPDWEARHRPVAERGFTAACTISRPGDGVPVFDPTTGTTTPPDPVTTYTGPCRVQANAGTLNEGNGGEQQVTTRDYLVAVPWTVEVEVGHVVTVTAASDPTLPGRRLLVADVLRGSLLWERDLTCTADEG